MEGDDVNLTCEVTISNAGAQQEGETAGAAAHADEDMTAVVLCIDALRRAVQD